MYFCPLRSSSNVFAPILKNAFFIPFYITDFVKVSREHLKHQKVDYVASNILKTTAPFGSARDYSRRRVIYVFRLMRDRQNYALLIPTDRVCQMTAGFPSFNVLLSFHKHCRPYKRRVMVTYARNQIILRVCHYFTYFDSTIEKSGLRVSRFYLSLHSWW